jgi:hypothetical protein
MKTIFSFLTVAFLVSLVNSSAAEKDTRCFEMRTYYAAPGKLDALSARFRNHTLKLFEKQGMVNIGYWIPAENPDNKLIYILAFPSAEARQEAWKNFGADPAWKEVVKTTEASGRLVTKVESVLMTATDFSPAIKTATSEPARCFELRTYTASPGNLDKLLARFRDHTLALFAKHGMTSIGYWTPVAKPGETGNTLVYILAHKSQAAAAESFQAFRADAAWVEAKKASEVNGPLTMKVESVFMTPTDYSPIR